MQGRKKGKIICNDALNTFYFRLYSVRYIWYRTTNLTRTKPLPPLHGLLFRIGGGGGGGGGEGRVLFTCPYALKVQACPLQDQRPALWSRGSFPISSKGSFIYTTTQTGKRERNVLFNDALYTFYLRLYSVRLMVKDHSDSERGNPLPPHRLLLSINSKGSFICTIPQTGYYIPRPLLHYSWSTCCKEKDQHH